MTKILVREICEILSTPRRRDAGLTPSVPMTRIRIPSLAGAVMKRLACLLLFVSLVTFGAFADDDHDHQHHEDLTETQLGTVHFPVSCAASVQKPFAHGVALLHSFWYEEAEKEFVQIDRKSTRLNSSHLVISYAV